MSRYSDITTLNTVGGKRYKATTNYPDIPIDFSDIYVYTDEGDRFDILAQTYYSDSSLWWVISTANPHLPQNSIFPPIGIQIIIPNNIGEIILEYNRLNGI